MKNEQTKDIKNWDRLLSPWGSWTHDSLFEHDPQQNQDNWREWSHHSWIFSRTSLTEIALEGCKCSDCKLELDRLGCNIAGLPDGDDLVYRGVILSIHIISDSSHSFKWCSSICNLNKSLLWHQDPHNHCWAGSPCNIAGPYVGLDKTSGGGNTQSTFWHAKTWLIWHSFLFLSSFDVIFYTNMSLCDCQRLYIFIIYMLKQIDVFVPWHSLGHPPFTENKLTTLKQIRQPSSPSKRENRPPAGVARAADGIKMTVIVGVLGFWETLL